MKHVPTSLITVIKIFCIDIFIYLFYATSINFVDKKVTDHLFRDWYDYFYTASDSTALYIQLVAMVGSLFTMLLISTLFWMTYSYRAYTRVYQTAKTPVRMEDLYEGNPYLNEIKLRYRFYIYHYFIVMSCVFIVTVILNSFAIKLMTLAVFGMSLLALVFMFIYAVSTYIACKVYRVLINKSLRTQ